MGNGICTITTNTWKARTEMKKRLFAILLVFALVFSLAACNKSSNNAGGSPAPGNSPAAPGKKVEVTAALGVIPNSLDPCSEDTNITLSLCFHIYDKLFELDPVTYKRIPGVAKSFKEIDSMNWEFEIDLSLKFQNGDSLTMEDVVYSIDRLKSIPKSSDTGKQIKSITYDGNILKLSATENNSAIIPRAVAMAPIVSKAYIESGGDDAVYKKPIGTGPYRCVEFTPGASLTIETWDGYVGPKPQIDIIHWVLIPEAAGRYIAVESGQVQYAGLVTRMEMDLAEKNPNVNTIQGISNRMLGLEFNCEKAPFDRTNVRRGILHAFDRENFCKLQGGRPPIKGALFCGFDEYYIDPPGLPEYDMAKAKELLEAEGISPANPIDCVIIYFPQNNDPGLEMFKTSLATLGINLILDLIEFSVYLQREAFGEFDMIFTSQPNRGGHPMTDLDRLDEDFIGTRCHPRFHNQEYQRLIKLLRASTDYEEQKKLILEIKTLYGHEAPIAGVYLTPILCVMSKGLTGVTVRADMIQSFRFATYTG